MIRAIRCYIEIGFWKLMFLFGVERDPKPIPKGQYCYEPDEEKNKAEKDTTIYHVKPCRFYRGYGVDGSACTYMGFIGFDIMLSDQCKICGVNNSFEEDEDNSSSL